MVVKIIFLMVLATGFLYSDETQKTVELSHELIDEIKDNQRLFHSMAQEMLQAQIAMYETEQGLKFIAIKKQATELSKKLEQINNIANEICSAREGFEFSGKDVNCVPKKLFSPFVPTN